MWSTNRSSTTPDEPGRAREDTREGLFHPARPAQSRQPALRISHFPDPPTPTLKHHSSPPIDIEGSQMSALPALTWWSSQRRHLVAPWLLGCSLTKRTDVDAVGFWCGEQLGWMVTVG